MKSHQTVHRFTVSNKLCEIFTRQGKFGYHFTGGGLNQSTFPVFTTGLEAHEAAINAARELHPRAKMRLVPMSDTRRSFIEGVS